MRHARLSNRRLAHAVTHAAGALARVPSRGGGGGKRIHGAAVEPSSRGGRGRRCDSGARPSIREANPKTTQLHYAALILTFSRNNALYVVTRFVSCLCRATAHRHGLASLLGTCRGTCRGTRTGIEERHVGRRLSSVAAPRPTPLQTRIREVRGRCGPGQAPGVAAPGCEVSGWASTRPLRLPRLLPRARCAGPACFHAFALAAPGPLARYNEALRLGPARARHGTAGGIQP